jgi:hypothetical protein
MPSDRFFPVLGPFKSELEIRTLGADSLAYAFPKLLPMSTSLSDAFMAAPTLASALSKLESHHGRSTPSPLVVATTIATGQLKTLYPGMNLAPLGIVYRLPREWGPVADQVAREDIAEVFGMPDLDQSNYRLRAARYIYVPGEGLPTKLLVDLQEHTDIVSQCCMGELGFIGQLVPQIVLCSDQVTVGGFFYDRAALEEHLAGIEHMKPEAFDENCPRQALALRQASAVGAEPWRHRQWPVLEEGASAYLVQVTHLRQ